MRCMVTGGAGFIGSNLVDALLAHGDEVTVVDDLSTGRRENLEAALAGGARLVEQDIREGGALAELAAAARPEVVFHLAAQIDVRRSVADPAFDASINVGGTANVLEAARRAGARRVVFSSTGGAIYGEGEGQELPLGEGAPIAPLSPYGQSKFAAEGYLALYERLHGLPGVSLRLGNVYGPRQDPLGEAGVVAIFCGRLRAGGRPTVYGDGRQTRDYIYVGDVVAAALAAAEAEASGPLNIGTGIETDVLELVERLGKPGRPGGESGGGGVKPDDRGSASDGGGDKAGGKGDSGDGGAGGGSAFEPEFAPARAGEVQRISIDPARAERELGWRAQTGLEQGLRLTLDSL